MGVASFYVSAGCHSDSIRMSSCTASLNHLSTERGRRAKEKSGKVCRTKQKALYIPGINVIICTILSVHVIVITTHSFCWQRMGDFRPDWHKLQKELQIANQVFLLCSRAHIPERNRTGPSAWSWPTRYHWGYAPPPYETDNIHHHDCHTQYWQLTHSDSKCVTSSGYHRNLDNEFPSLSVHELGVTYVLFQFPIQ